MTRRGGECGVVASIYLLTRGRLCLAIFTNCGTETNDLLEAITSTSVDDIPVHTRRLITVSTRITIALNRVGSAALNVLTADGTPAQEAVLAAIIYAAERRPVSLAPEAQAHADRQEYADRLLSLVEDAPPLTGRQRKILNEAFGSASQLGPECDGQ